MSGEGGRKLFFRAIYQTATEFTFLLIRGAHQKESKFDSSMSSESGCRPNLNGSLLFVNAYNFLVESKRLRQKVLPNNSMSTLKKFSMKIQEAKSIFFFV
jgi:hypothetical protein